MKIRRYATFYKWHLCSFNGTLYAHPTLPPLNAFTKLKYRPPKYYSRNIRFFNFLTLNMSFISQRRNGLWCHAYLIFICTSWILQNIFMFHFKTLRVWLRSGVTWIGGIMGKYCNLSQDSLKHLWRRYAQRLTEHCILICLGSKDFAFILGNSSDISNLEDPPTFCRSGNGRSDCVKSLKYHCQLRLIVCAIQSSTSVTNFQPWRISCMDSRSPNCALIILRGFLLVVFCSCMKVHWYPE